MQYTTKIVNIYFIKAFIFLIKVLSAKVWFILQPVPLFTVVIRIMVAKTILIFKGPT